MKRNFLPEKENMFNVKAKYLVYFVITTFAIKVIFFDLKREQNGDLAKTYSINGKSIKSSTSGTSSTSRKIASVQQTGPSLKRVSKAKENLKNALPLRSDIEQDTLSKELFERQEFENFVLNWMEKKSPTEEKLIALTEKIKSHPNAKLVAKFRQFFFYSIDQIDDALNPYKVVVGKDSKVKLFNGLIKIKVKDNQSFDLVANAFPYNIQNKFKHLNLIFIKFPFDQVKEKIIEIEEKFNPISVSYEYIERFQEN